MTSLFQECKGGEAAGVWAFWLGQGLENGREAVMALAFPRSLKQNKRFGKLLLLYILFNMTIQIVIKMYYHSYYFKLSFY